MKTIVLAYDDSEQALRELGRAADLTGAFAATLVVVSVSPLPYGPAAVPVLEPDLAYAPSAVGGAMPTGDVLPASPAVEPRAEPKELAQRRLEAARMTLTRQRIDAEYVAEVATPAERVLGIAEERDADLIVVGSREHGLLERLLHRPVEQSVATHAGCDVLLVH